MERYLHTTMRVSMVDISREQAIENILLENVTDLESKNVKFNRMEKVLFYE